MIAAIAPPVGENFAGHAFRCVRPPAASSADDGFSQSVSRRHLLPRCPRRVSTFQAEALATLSRFQAALGDCSTDGHIDLDVSELRVPPLQEQLEAVSRDEAAGIAGPLAASGITATDGALSLAADGDAGGPCSCHASQLRRRGRCAGRQPRARAGAAAGVRGCTHHGRSCSRAAGHG